MTDVFTGGPKARAKANIEAVKALESLSWPGTSGSDALYQRIAEFSGWGCLPDLFDEDKESWSDLRDELTDLIGESAFEGLGRSVLDSHYTAPEVIEAMWSAVKAAGFSGGKVLDPGCGASYFRRFMPKELVGKASITGVERESIAARIGAALFSDVEVVNRPFEDFPVVNDTFDLVIGNVPFGDQSVHDPMHREMASWSIHNYFIGKSIAKLRPGGLLAVVVSRYFLDAINSECREWIDRHAELVGAVRLPAGTFRRSAGTEVVSDIVILRRRDEDLGKDEPPSDWVGTEFFDVDGEATRINRWFVSRPDLMLGDVSIGSGLYGQYTLQVDRSIDEALWQEVEARLSELAKDVLSSGSYLPSGDEYADRDEIGWKKVAGALERRDGELVITADDEIAECVMTDQGVRFFEAGLEGKRAERARGMIELCGLVRSLLDAEEANDESSMGRMRQKLNYAYDRFTRKHGPLNGRGNSLVFRNDPGYPLLCSLEVDFEDAITKTKARQFGCDPRPARWRKADIFNRPVNVPRQKPAPTTPREALTRSLAEFGRVRLGDMARWLGVDQDALIEELSGLIFLDPVTGDWLHRDQYLSGNVRRKLEMARNAAEQDAQFFPNVAELEKVQPADIEAADISAPINSPWLPGDVLSEFFEYLLGEAPASDPRVVGGDWIVDLPKRHNGTHTQVWGTDRRPAHDLIECIMNDRDLTVYDTVYDVDGSQRRVINADDTAAAKGKADDIIDEWDGWIWSDPMRRRRLVRIYNDEQNTHADTDFDGSFLLDENGCLPGMSRAISLRKTQVDAIWQGIVVGTTLFDHRVGAGKTFASLGLAMELKRMGFINKPMFVVPNHLVQQWAAEAARMYPGAKILAAGRKDFEKNKRQRMFARIATNDWDIVIIAHSSFKFIRPPKSVRFGMLDEMAREISHAIDASGTKTSTEKRLQRRRDKIQNKMKRLMEAPRRDDVIDFDQIGVDHIAYDESQAAKNLQYFTSYYGVLGLGPSEGSQVAFDLFCKVRWLQDKYDGRGVNLLTGTPISNSIAEMFHTLRFLCYPELRIRGIHTLDSWARIYANPTASYELAVSGKYKLVTRFAQFQNVPEMMRLYRHYAHVVTKADLEASGSDWRVPPMRGGKPDLVICPRSEQVAEYMDSILERCEDLKGKDPRKDNMLKIMSDARKAALDYRIIEPGAPADEAGKVHECARRILEDYQRWNGDKGTQLVFCDLSVPAAHSRALQKSATDSDEAPDHDSLLAVQGAHFSVYDYLKALLVSWGIPEHEIEFAHDASTDEQKFAQQERVRQGKVRVLIGSTQKMGTGMNVQDRLVAMHELDLPFRPSDLEQRLGRIERSGSLLFEKYPDFEIGVYRYGTERTLDARMAQTIELKARFIDEIRAGGDRRVIKDIGGETESAGAMKASLSGNPLILAHFEAQHELDSLHRQYKAHLRRQMAMQDSLERTEDWESKRDAAIAGIRADKATAKRFGSRVWESDGHRHLDDCSQRLGETVNAAFSGYGQWQRYNSADEAPVLGHYRGFAVIAWRTYWGSAVVSVRGEYLRADFKPGQSGKNFSGAGLCKRMDNLIATLEGAEDREIARADEVARDRKKMEESLNREFKHADRLKTLKTVVNVLTGCLAEGRKELPDDVDPEVSRLVDQASVVATRANTQSSAPAPQASAERVTDEPLDDGEADSDVEDDDLFDNVASKAEPVQTSLFG